MHNAPGAYSKYAPGAYVKCTMLQGHVYICSWNSVHSNNAPVAY